MALGLFITSHYLSTIISRLVFCRITRPPPLNNTRRSSFALALNRSIFCEGQSAVRDVARSSSSRVTGPRACPGLLSLPHLLPAPPFVTAPCPVYATYGICSKFRDLHAPNSLLCVLFHAYYVALLGTSCTMLGDSFAPSVP